MDPIRPADKLVKRSLELLKGDFVVVGKRRVSLFTLSLVGMFVVGAVAAFALLASRSGTLEETLAASDYTEDTAYIESEDAVPTFSIRTQETKESQKIREVSGKATKLAKRIKNEAGVTRTASIADMRELLQERKNMLSALLKNDPATAFMEFFPETVLADLPEEAKRETEQPVVALSPLEVIHKDDFEKKTGEFQYFLRQEGKRYDFYPVGSTQPLMPSSRVRVKGYQIGESIVAATAGNTFEVLQAAEQKDSLGDQKTLVVLVNFLDSPPVPFTRDEAERLVFESNMQAFYHEASYGKTSWSGDVVGWYTVPRNGIDASGYVRWPQFPMFQNESDYDGISAFIQSEGIDIKNYTRLVFFANHNSMGAGFASIGKLDMSLGEEIHRLSLAWIGSLQSFSYQWSPFIGSRPFEFTVLDFILSHELGHNLGVFHANSWECGAKKVLSGTKCQHIEYGNWFDVMGYGLIALHFNAFFKDAFGWLDSPLTITTSGTYTINALESGSGVHAAKIFPPSFSSAPYYVEYRRPEGFDAGIVSNAPQSASNQNGLLINSALSPLSYPFSRLLDMTPKSSDYEDWTDIALLKKGKILFDPARSTVIGPVLSQDDSSITFKVQILPPKCIRQKPAVVLNPLGGGYGALEDSKPVVVSPGDYPYLYISLQNLDSILCGSSDFEISAKVPRGWSYISYFTNPVSVNSDDDTFWSAIQIRVPEDSVSKEYPVEVRVKNLKSKSLTTTRIIYNVQE